uniref:Small VCP/p97-interacting protein n=1 Tax=Ciona intestinalis TaxID=7719 RepID=H2XJJ4_CIOIN|nr:small VCP/p97-interacting protein [Ciona intestinalis]|eukprot:XP_018672979.1 small VCP/p97-interacting protein [Ciona intestinalis]
MGSLFSCCLGNDYETPDPEVRRQQMLEAAERRKQEYENRGLKDPEGVKAKQRKREAAEKSQEQIGSNENNLRWQVS